jgi:hypothetical protein
VCALPDDILRAIVALVSTSDLIALVRCSQRFEAEVELGGELSRRLDGAFVVMPRARSSFWGGFPCKMLLPFTICRGDLETLFGAADVRGYFSFAEAPRPDGSFQMHPSNRHEIQYFAHGENLIALIRFAGWLKPRVEHDKCGGGPKRCQRAEKA